MKGQRFLDLLTLHCSKKHSNMEISCQVANIMQSGGVMSAPMLLKQYSDNICKSFKQNIGKIEEICGLRYLDPHCMLNSVTFYLYSAFNNEQCHKSALTEIFNIYAHYCQ